MMNKQVMNKRVMSKGYSNIATSLRVLLSTHQHTLITLRTVSLPKKTSELRFARRVTRKDGLHIGRSQVSTGNLSKNVAEVGGQS